MCNILKSIVQARAPFLTEAVEATKGQKILNGGSGINVHYSGSQSASVIVRFVKTSGQARSLLCVNFWSIPNG